jgi:3-hydroxyisobutyrate dehydrogenase
MSALPSSAPASPPILGFIGLGNMGAPMAANLRAAGYPLVVHDVHRPAADGLLAQGATWADTPAAVALAADIVCTSLPGPREMQAVSEGPSGFLDVARAGSLWVDFTTNSPLLVRALHAKLAARGAGLIDAPVSGGVTGARTRRLTVQVGGDEAAVARARPVLEAVADTVLHVGAVGAGCICKVLHNCAVFSTDLAMVECLTAGIKAGVAPDTLIEVFQKSGLGRNHDLHVALPARLFRGNFRPPHFALRTALKDMGLATELARAVDVPMALAERCEQEMRDAVARGWGDCDENIFLTLQEERAGVQVRTAASGATAS